MSSAVVVVGLLLTAAVLQLVLQKYAPLYAWLLSLCAAAALLVRVGAAVQLILQGAAALTRQTDGQAFACLLRCAGILLLADYTRTLCEEAGADSLGWCAGFAGRCLVLAAAYPLLAEVCQQIWGLAG